MIDLTVRWLTRAPALAAGAFVVACGAAAAEPDPVALARQLGDDGCWTECRRECDRVLAAHPGHPVASDLRAESGRRVHAAPAPTDGTAGSLPGRGIVAVYRSLVRPAIGARCSLHPSCSEYLLQASRRHGLLAFPMMADRLVREPSVVHDHPVPAPPGGEVRVPDPLSDHDFWMHPRRRAAARPHRNTPP